jgi:hypothetical protein
MRLLPARLLAVAALSATAASASAAQPADSHPARPRAASAAPAAPALPGPGVPAPGAAPGAAVPPPGVAVPPPAPLAPIAADEYAARRRALAALLPDSVETVVVLGAGEPAEDYLRFEQAPSFRYLTGFTEPDAALLLVRRPGGDVDGTLFVQPNDPAREVWTGRRAGPAGARAATGLAARPTGELRATLDSVARAARRRGGRWRSSASSPRAATPCPPTRSWSRRSAAIIRRCACCRPGGRCRGCAGRRAPPSSRACAAPST